MAESYSVEAYLKATDQGFTATMQNAIGSTEKLTQSAGKTNSSILDIAKGMGVFKVVDASINMVKSSLDAAITRFDKLNQFPKVLTAMGASTEDAARATNKLKEGIDGLPTRLQDVSDTTQQMFSVFKNADKAADSTLALNNALLASGSSGDKAARGTEQYMKILRTGKVEMDSYSTLQETMGYGLDLLAEKFGFTGGRAKNDLYEALKSGEVTINDFNKGLIEIQDGLGGTKEVAKTTSEGIATSFGNMRNSVTAGLANFIKQFDILVEAVTGKNIAKNLDGMKVAISATFKAINATMEASTPIVKGFASAITGTINVARPLTPVVLGLAASFGALKVLQGINSLMIASDIAIGMAALSTKGLTISTMARMTAQIADTNATKADIIAKSAQNGVVSLSTVLMGVLGGAITITEVASIAATAATTAFSAAIKLLLGSVGVVIAVIGGLVAAATAAWKWLNKDTEATAKLKEAQSELADSTKKVTDATEASASSRKDSTDDIVNSNTAYQKLGETITQLAGKEKKTANDKKILKANVEELNEAIDGLNLAYDAETGRLSLSTEQMQARIAAFKEQELANKSQSELTDILKEQAAVESKLAETNLQREKWNELLGKGWKQSQQAKDGIKELDEQEKALKETQEQLQAEYTATQEIQNNAMASVTAATEAGVFQQITSYESLNEAQQSAVDKMRSNFQSLQESATNAFDKINTDSKVSLGQMVENMAHNQTAVQQWGENQAALLAWAGQNGHDSFIPFIESIGVDQAGVLAQMVKGVDGTNQEQAALLEQLATTYQTGFGTAAEAGKQSMILGLEGLPEDVKNLVIQPVGSLNGEVKAVFSEMGKNVGAGAKEGIEAGTPAAANASGKMANEVSKSFATAAQIQSPSRVFKSHGGFIVDGLVLGIKSGAGNITSAMNAMFNIVNSNGLRIAASGRQIASSFTQSFSGLPSQMSAIGSYAMQGFAAGINGSAGAAISAANSVASQVKATIQKSLDVHSPSRWMKNFIGKNMMIGWADGISQYAKYAVNSVSNAVNTVQDAFQPQSFDLGGQLMAANSNLVASVSSRNDFNANASYAFTTVVELDGREVAKGTAKFTQDELNKMKVTNNRLNGRR